MAAAKTMAIAAAVAAAVRTGRVSRPLVMMDSITASAVPANVTHTNGKRVAGTAAAMCGHNRGKQLAGHPVCRVSGVPTPRPPFPVPSPTVPAGALAGVRQAQ